MKKFLLIAAALLLAPTFASGQMCTLTFQTESLPAFFVDTPANFKIEAVSGTPPYRFEIVDGALPDGLHMNQNGRISGKAHVEETTTVFIRLSDAAGCSLVQAFNVEVLPEDQAP